jgi:hypothetical protein
LGTIILKSLIHFYTSGLLSLQLCNALRHSDQNLDLNANYNRTCFLSSFRRAISAAFSSFDNTLGVTRTDWEPKLPFCDSEFFGGREVLDGVGFEEALGLNSSQGVSSTTNLNGTLAKEILAHHEQMVVRLRM